MNRISHWFHTALTGKPAVPAAYSYTFLLVLFYLVYLQVSLQLRFPQFTSSHLSGFFTVAMLIINHLAFCFSWGSARVRAVLRVTAFMWIIFVWVFLVTRPKPNHARQRTGRAVGPSLALHV